jgi:hypothetical protein
VTGHDVRRYRQRGAPIIHDTIDNETIAINQMTGAYYSLEGASALAWECLASGASTTDIAAVLAAAYIGERGEIDAAVEAFVAELLAEQLIVPTPPHGMSQNGHVPAQPTSNAQGKPFTGLRLQRYTDLEVMLLADPIHEVDETGWPMPLTEAKE